MGKSGEAICHGDGFVFSVFTQNSIAGRPNVEKDDVKGLVAGLESVELLGFRAKCYFPACNDCTLKLLSRRRGSLKATKIVTVVGTWSGRVRCVLRMGTHGRRQILCVGVIQVPLAIVSSVC